MNKAGPWSLIWPHGALGVEPLGGMIGPLRLRSRAGRKVELFAVAPWSGMPRDSWGPGVPGHLIKLRGAFPCLPFGMASRPAELTDEWRGLPFADDGEPPHGHCANEAWRCVARDESGLAIEYRYPTGHAIAVIRQSIQVDPAQPTLSVAITVTARRAVRLTFGQHFILRLSPDLVLHAPDFAFGLTYPARVEPGVMIARTGQSFSRLEAVPAASGGLVDLTRPPLDRPIEDVLQLCGVGGPVLAEYADEGVALEIDWDRTALPSCLLWLSHHGVQEDPWRGRFVGIGVEPIASAFDFAAAVSGGPNPIAARGVATAIDFTPDRPWSTRFRLRLV